MKQKILLLFLLILGIGILFRTYLVTEIPPGINRDEGSIGYTAYSILKNGMDEYGASYPLSFQSFGDWKLPLYIYSVVPLISIFGLSELSVRLTSILAGIGTIIVTFFLVKELFKNNTLALITMFLTAVAPWHVHLSRVESEANTAVFFVSLGVLLFLKALRGAKWLLVPSSILFALSYYTYAGNYIFTTLLVGGLLVIYNTSLFRSKYLLVGIAVFLILSAIIFSQTVFSANKTKLSGINIFGDPSVVHAKIEMPRTEHGDQPLFTRVVHNRVVFGLERFAQNYINSFSPQFLFIHGGTNRAHNIQNFGNMFIVESLFLLLGFMYLFTKKKDSSDKLVLWWFLIAPLAAAITKDAPHTNRMFAIFPILPLVTAIGMYSALEYSKKFPFRKVIIVFVALLFLLNIALYVDRYFVHFPKNEVESWGLGYKALYEKLEMDYPNKQIVISRPEYSPYIFFLFYSKYDPKRYVQTVERYPATEDGFVHVKKYDRFEFRDIDWSNDVKTGKVLVAHPSEVPDFVMTFQFKKSYVTVPNGKTMFVLVEPNEK